MVVGVVLALTIAVLFDSPTSVFLLVGLVIAFAFLTIFTSQAAGAEHQQARAPPGRAIHNFGNDGPLADPPGSVRAAGTTPSRPRPGVLMPGVPNVDDQPRAGGEAVARLGAVRRGPALDGRGVRACRRAGRGGRASRRRSTEAPDRPRVPPLWLPVAGASVPSRRACRALRSRAPGSTSRPPWKSCGRRRRKVVFAGQVAGTNWVSVWVAPDVVASVGPLQGELVAGGWVRRGTPLGGGSARGTALVRSAGRRPCT